MHLNLINKIANFVTYFRLNKYSTFFCFFAPAPIGSVVSFFFSAGGIVSTTAFLTRRVALNTDRAMVAQTIAIGAYCCANVFASLVNGVLFVDAFQLLSLVPLLFFPFSYSFLSVSDKGEIARASVVGSALACFSGLAIALFQHYWFHMRAEGGAGNAIVFATVTSLALATCLSGALSGQMASKPTALLACLSGAVAIVLSGSRIIWVTTALIVLLVLFIHRRSINMKASPRFLGLLLLILIPVAVVGFPIVSTRINAFLADWAALTSQGNYGNPLGFRLALWHVGVDRFWEMPWFGHGVGAVKGLIAHGLQDQFGLEEDFSHFHNGFLNASVASGVVGATALAAIFIVALRNGVRALRASNGKIERFGASLLVIVAVTYLAGGMTGILLGHDILDSVLIIFLLAGTYLSSGTPRTPLHMQDDPALDPVR